MVRWRLVDEGVVCACASGVRSFVVATVLLDRRHRCFVRKHVRTMACVYVCALSVPRVLRSLSSTLPSCLCLVLLSLVLLSLPRSIALSACPLPSLPSSLPFRIACVSVSLRACWRISSIRRVDVDCQSLIVSPLSPLEHGAFGLVRGLCCLVCVCSAVSARCRSPPLHLSPSIHRCSSLTCMRKPLTLAPSLHRCDAVVAAAVCVADADTYTWSMLPREL
jgi:hypothetical protein